MTRLFDANEQNISDLLLSDFTVPLFRDAFKQYFAEMGIRIRDWDGLFKEMNDEGDNLAIFRTTTDGDTVGFIMIKPTKFTSWFFEETYGFIREFWIASDFRGKGHGTALLDLAEKYFCESNIYTSILTTNTAELFYKKHGYFKAPGCKAKNQDEVFIKRLR